MLKSWLSGVWLQPLPLTEVLHKQDYTSSFPCVESSSLSQIFFGVDYLVIG